MVVGDQGAAEHALHGVVHPDTRLEETECPEAVARVGRHDARREGERADGAHERAELRVQREGAVAGLHGRDLRAGRGRSGGDECV